MRMGIYILCTMVLFKLSCAVSLRVFPVFHKVFQRASCSFFECLLNENAKTGVIVLSPCRGCTAFGGLQALHKWAPVGAVGRQQPQLRRSELGHGDSLIGALRLKSMLDEALARFRMLKVEGYTEETNTPLVLQTQD